MKFLTELFGNRIFISAALGWFVAQVLKTLIHMFITKQFVMERMVGSGGMPSSHSALVCSMTVGMAKLVGFDSPLFGLTFAFAMVVMYDAMGVRRAAGEQAKVLNRIIFSRVFDLLNEEIDEDFGEREGEERPDGAPDQKELKEYLGHTPLEVLGGMLLGVLIASVLSPPGV